MLIIDDILLFPIRSILWIFRELHNAAQQEMENEAESITAELSDLYMMLETERITEAEFDTREKQLLDRLEMIQERNTQIEDDEDPDTPEA
ncbi:MAG: gas vesicle protein GvpG [Desulfobacterales bacterium]|nr:gas vesicle protein GvpG [Desulfobacterales bacterium]